MKIFDIKDVFADLSQFENPSSQVISIYGRVNTVRGNNKIKFITINDGSSINDLQIVCKAQQLEDFDSVINLKRSSVVQVTGSVILTPNKPQPCEISAQAITVIIEPLFDSPLQKKDHT